MLATHSTTVEPVIVEALNDAVFNPSPPLHKRKFKSKMRFCYYAIM